MPEPKGSSGTKPPNCPRKASVLRIPTKWDRFGTSIFSVMTQKALASGAVNLAQGFPDFDGPDAVKDAAIAAIRAGKNQYAPATGLPELRAALADHQERRAGLTFDPDKEVTVFSGATEALYCAFQLLEPGDEVIAFEPYYDSYPAAAHAAGAKLLGVPLTPGSWTLDAARLASAVTPRTRAIIVNTPHNPTGHCFTAHELGVVAELAKAKDLLVFTDEVYEELVFAPARHLGIATLPGMRERTITISSTSKTFSFTGWKVGYAFAPAPLTKALRAVHQFTVFCSATPLQAGMVAALKLGPEYYDELRKDYLARRDALLGILESAGFRCSVPEGTYFVLADYSKIRDVPDLEFATWLIDTAKVAAIPISVFYAENQDAAKTLRYVRFAFCKGMPTLEAAGSRLSALRKRL